MDPAEGAEPSTGVTGAVHFPARAVGGAVNLDFGPLLRWRQDEQVHDLLEGLRQADGAAAVGAFGRLLEETQVLLEHLPSFGPSENVTDDAESRHTRTSLPLEASPSAWREAAATIAADSTVAGVTAGVTASSGAAQAASEAVGSWEAARPPVATSAGANGSAATTASAVCSSASALLELCWEKLHLGYWKDVHLAWRNGYTLACIIHVTLQLLILQDPGPDSEGLDQEPVPNPNSCGKRPDPGSHPPQPPVTAAAVTRAITSTAHGNTFRSAPAAAAAAAPCSALRRRRRLLLEGCLRQLDLGIMMGGPLWRPHAHVLVDALHSALAAMTTEAQGPAVEGRQEGAMGPGTAAGGIRGGDGGGDGGGCGRPAKRLRGDGSAAGLGMQERGQRALSRHHDAVDLEVKGPGDQGAGGAAGPATPFRTPSYDGGGAGGGMGAVRLPPGSLGGPPGHRVPVSDAPGLEEFLLSYMVPERPVVVAGAMEHWPALSRWSDMSYLERAAGGRTVPVEVGQHYLADGWGQQLMTIKDFLRKHIIATAGSAAPAAPHDSRPAPDTPKPPEATRTTEPSAAAATTAATPDVPTTVQPPPLGYLAQHPLFEQIPALRADIVEPDYCCLGEGEVQAVNAWLGPAGTTTPLHTDPHHNLLAQVVGRKYIRLYAPSLTAQLHPFPAGSVNHNSSQVNLDLDLDSDPNPDSDCHLALCEDRDSDQGAANLATGVATADDATTERRPGDSCGSADDGGAVPAPSSSPRPQTASPLGRPSFEDRTPAEGRLVEGVAAAGRGSGSAWRCRRLRIPGVASLPYEDVVLEPGQMLYIPPGWWHFVRSLTTSFSVSFWWR